MAALSVFSNELQDSVIGGRVRYYSRKRPKILEAHPYCNHSGSSDVLVVTSGANTPAHQNRAVLAAAWGRGHPATCGQLPPAMLSALPSASLLGFAPSKPFVLRVDATAAEAFRTLHAARDAMRAGLGHGFERHIHIAGDHKLDRPLVLDARDSGSPEAPIVYTTDPAVDATAALSGGVQVPATAWERAVGPTGIPLLKASLFDLGLNGSLLGGLQNPCAPLPSSQL